MTGYANENILEQSRAEQSRAEQSRAEQSRAEQSRLNVAFLLHTILYSLQKAGESGHIYRDLIPGFFVLPEKCSRKRRGL